MSSTRSPTREIWLLQSRLSKVSAAFFSFHSVHTHARTHEHARTVASFIEMSWKMSLCRRFPLQHEKPETRWTTRRCTAIHKRHKILWHFCSLWSWTKTAVLQVGTRESQSGGVAAFHRHHLDQQSPVWCGWLSAVSLYGHCVALSFALWTKVFTSVSKKYCCVCVCVCTCLCVIFKKQFLYFFTCKLYWASMLLWTSRGK